MFSAIFAFLGGSAFRMIWGEVSAWVTAHQEHRFETERMIRQAEYDAVQHIRHLETLRVQNDLGVQTVRVRSEADVALAETAAWGQSVVLSQQPTGVWLIDAWNGAIRPLAASIAVVLWVLALNAQGWQMGEWDKELVGVVLGFFFASRELLKRSK